MTIIYSGVLGCGQGSTVFDCAFIGSLCIVTARSSATIHEFGRLVRRGGARTFGGIVSYFTTETKREHGNTIANTGDGKAMEHHFTDIDHLLSGLSSALLEIISALFKYCIIQFFSPGTIYSGNTIDNIDPFIF